MLAYKFLRPEAVALYSGLRWPQPDGDAPGEWVAATDPLVPCVSGIHACRQRDLPQWIDDELWRIELDGELIDQESMIVARRGRLVAQVEEWDTGAARDFAAACVARAREHAASLLTRSGRAREAKSLAEVPGDELQTCALQAASASTDTIAEVLSLAADTVSLARGERPESQPSPTDAYKPTAGPIAANLGFVVAHVAGRARTALEPAGYDDGFENEREWQRRWLKARLGL